MLAWDCSTDSVKDTKMNLDFRDLDRLVRTDPVIEHECFEWAYNRGFLSGSKTYSMQIFDNLKRSRNTRWLLLLNGITTDYNAKYSMPLRSLHNEVLSNADAKEECFQAAWKNKYLPADELVARTQFNSDLTNYYHCEKYLSELKHQRGLEEMKKNSPSGWKKWAAFAALSIPTAIGGYLFYDSIKSALDNVPILGKAWEDLGALIPAGLIGLEAYLCLRSKEGKYEDSKALKECKQVDPIANMNFEHIDDLFSKM